MTLSEVCPDEAYIKNSVKGAEEKFRVVREGLIYTIAPGDDPMFFPGRAADIIMKRDGGEFKKIGR